MMTVASKLILRTLFATTLTTLALAAFAGCADRADGSADCLPLCERYSECFDVAYDTDACFDRCRASASRQPNFRSITSACSACVTDIDCAAATFNCAGDCSGLVP